MQFESFSNELLLEIFQFLPTSNIYHAFHDLNTHFNAVILEYFRTCNINFRSISKFDFDIICQYYLPQTIDRITSLCLSDDDDTPGQIDEFFSYGSSIRQFINLQSLFLCNIRSEKLMERIIWDLSYLSNLTHLQFEQCYFPSQNNPNKAISFGNSIWNLPKLVYFCFEVKYKYRQSHHFVNKYRRDDSICITPTVISSTLECVSFIGLERCDIAIDQLIRHTPRLQRLLIDNYMNIGNNPPSTILSTTTLIMKMPSYEYYNYFFNLLQMMPNLYRLKVDFDCTYVSSNAQVWERTISNYLPNLKRLQFQITDRAYSMEEKDIDNILKRYQNPFWLEKHRWFVQCDWNINKDYFNLYTLPYAFDEFRVTFPIRSKSTLPYDNTLRSYDCVHSLMYKPRFYSMSSPDHMKFFRIQHLSIDFPVTNHFWSLVPKFDHLISLDVLSNNHDEVCQYQLQDLLNRAPRLSSIRIGWKTLTSPLKQLFDSQNLSVYQVELIPYGTSLNREKCIMLNSIIPGIHCKILNLVVANRTCILDLINTLNHLYALNIRCQNDKFKHDSESTKDKLCEWLQGQLSSTFSNTKISRQDNVIRLWIGEK